MTRLRGILVVLVVSTLSVPTVLADWRWNGARWQQGPRLPHQNAKNSLKDTKNFWLIPRDPQNCLPADKAQIIHVDKDKVSVVDCTTGSRTLKFPGCAEIKADIQLLQELSTSLFAEIDFEWQNVNQFVGNLKCEKQEPNGCNGVGNGCYYCDVCKGIVQLQAEHKVKKDDEFQCPTKPKIYQLTKKLNISDWSGLDANNNGVIDFLEDDNLQKIRDYLKAIDVVGFGTLNIKMKLAHNGTESQLQQKKAEEVRIRNDVTAKYKRGEKSDDDIRKEVEAEINHWHRHDYLPWLMSVNQIACVNFFFDVCLNEPSPFNVQSSFQCV